MSNRILPAAMAMRRGILAASLAAALGLPLFSIAGVDVHHPRSNEIHAPSAPASPHLVTTCVDDPNLPGSLRYEVLHASSNDTIDLTPLKMVCSTITLGSEIDVQQSSINLLGPGSKYLTVDGNHQSRVFYHGTVGSSDTLLIQGLTIANGYYINDVGAKGGCILSLANVSLVDSNISGCQVLSSSPINGAAGGGVYAYGNLTLNGTQIVGNQAAAHYGARATGGGIAVHGNFMAKYSAISDNSAEAIPSSTSKAGGVAASSSVYILNSTIDGNRADLCGGVDALGDAQATVTIVSSTISSNSANVNVGGLYSGPPLSLENSTVAFNEVRGIQSSVSGLAARASISLFSSIVADNSGPIGSYDLNQISYQTVTVTGSNSLVTSSALPLPPGTITSCPQLGPLAFNGGPTRTHAPSHTSPAIDHGSAGSQTIDQRLEPRVSGAGADIGAVERQLGEGEDRMFVSGFERLCDQ